MSVVAKEASGNILDEFSLFKPKTSILKSASRGHTMDLRHGELSFDVSRAGLYQLELFGLNGRLVSSMIRLFPNGTAHFGIGKLRPGAYSARITGNGTVTNGMILIK